MKLHNSTWLFAGLLVACNGTPDLVTGTSSTDAIVNGQREPINTFLTENEKLAIIFLADRSGEMFCSGTLIAPRLVATARHCTIDNADPLGSIRVGFGLKPGDDATLIPLAELHEHPDIDFTLLVLGTDATVAVPGVQPIGMNRDPVDASWLGRQVDAAGYGVNQPYTSINDGRFFASVKVIGSDSETVTVDGEGIQGICSGDSGGPILWQPDTQTPPVVVGTEQGGDMTCVDVDHLTRVDVVAAWVDAIAAAGLPPELTLCEGGNVASHCEDGDAVWCANGYRYTHNCVERGQSCGYLGSKTGYDCLPSECGDIDYNGQCDGNIYSYCGAASGLNVSDCAAGGGVCAALTPGARVNCQKCTACDGVCMDLTSSNDNCGSCGNSCNVANAIAHCAEGECVLDRCLGKTADTDSNVSNGCEDTEGRGCQGTRASPGLAALAVIALWVGRRLRRR